MYDLPCSILVVVALAKPVTAEFLDGNRISRWCLAELYQSSEWFCDGYVAGVADASKELCIPSSVTVAQTSDIFKKYLRNHPEDRHLNAQSLVFRALSEAWPCE
jgi:hypothetical protein